MFTNKAMQLAPARFKSLKYSFGIATSHTAQNQAVKLAPTVKAFRPGVYQVGACICDLWRMSCTCKTARANKIKDISQQSKPCPHFVALFLAGEWLPTDPDPMLYNKSVGIEQPEIIGFYGRVKHPKTRHIVTVHVQRCGDSLSHWQCRDINSQDTWYLFPSQWREIKYLRPFYE